MGNHLNTASGCLSECNNDAIPCESIEEDGAVRQWGNEDQRGVVQRRSVQRRATVEENYLLELRRAHLAENRAKVQGAVDKSSKSNKTRFADESDKVVTVDVEECKDRYLAKMGAIHDLAGRSPLGELAAEQIIYSLASKIGMAKIEAPSFVDAMHGIVGSKGTPKELLELFELLDCDGLGYLTHAQWVSAFPIFFCSDDEIHKLIFLELDHEHNGALSEVELAAYATPFVNMLLPPGQVELRQKLRTSVSTQMFHSISDHCGGGKVTSDTFAEWFKDNSISELAFYCLEMLLNDGSQSDSRFPSSPNMKNRKTVRRAK